MVPQTHKCSLPPSSPAAPRALGRRLSHAECALCGLEHALPLSESTHLKSGRGHSHPMISLGRSSQGWDRFLGGTDPILSRRELPRPVQSAGPGGRAGHLTPLIVNAQAKHSAHSGDLPGGCWTCAGRRVLPQGASRVWWLWKRRQPLQKVTVTLLVGLCTSCSASRCRRLYRKVGV